MYRHFCGLNRERNVHLCLYRDNLCNTKICVCRSIHRNPTVNSWTMVCEYQRSGSLSTLLLSLKTSHIFFSNTIGSSSCTSPDTRMEISPDLSVPILSFCDRTMILSPWEKERTFFEHKRSKKSFRYGRSSWREDNSKRSSSIFEP